MNHLLLNTIALEPNRWKRPSRPTRSILGLLQPIAEAGFRFLEVWQYHLSLEGKEAIGTIREACRGLDLAIRIVGLYPKLHLAGAERERELDQAGMMLDYAALLGASGVKIFVGSQGAQALSGDEYTRSVDMMRMLALRAREKGLVVTGETHEKTLFDSVESCQRFLRDTGADNFKVCFQPYNSRDTHQAIRDFENLVDHVVHLHLQGRKNGKYDFLENSDIDYGKLMQALAVHRFNGDISIEFVKDCVVQDPSDFDLDLVLRNAQRDRTFVLTQAAACGMPILG